MLSRSIFKSWLYLFHPDPNLFHLIERKERLYFECPMNGSTLKFGLDSHTAKSESLSRNWCRWRILIIGS